MKIMTRKLFVLFVLIITTFSLSFPYSTAFSQAESPAGDVVFNFEKAYKDLVFNISVYERAHSEYLLARGQYLQAKTLASQTKAQEATVLMLQTRDEVVRTYLLALRMRLLEAEGTSDTAKSSLLARIDNEISWFEGHKGRISSAGTLEDLVDDSEEASEHFADFTEPLCYEFLVTIPSGRVTNLRNTLSAILTRIKTKTAAIRAKGDHDTSITERWIIETENKVTRSLDKEVEVQGLIAQFIPGGTSRKKDPAAIYSEALLKIRESHQFLQEASNFLKEIIRSIKTKTE